MMKKMINGILGFLIGFYGMALWIDTPEMLLFKSKILFGGVFIVTILKIIDDLRTD
jgi:hypothetical protein